MVRTQSISIFTFHHNDLYLQYSLITIWLLKLQPSLKIYALLNFILLLQQKHSMLVIGLVMRKQHRYITCSIFSLMLVSFQISQQFIIKVPCNFLRMFPLLYPQESRCGSIHGVDMCLSLLLSLFCPYHSKPTTHPSYFPFNRMISLNTQSFHWKLVLYIFF